MKYLSFGSQEFSMTFYPIKKPPHGGLYYDLNQIYRLFSSTFCV